jgi:hypothetical protein
MAARAVDSAPSSPIDKEVGCSSFLGFAKNERANITKEERKALLKLGHEYMRLSDKQLGGLVQEEKIIEVECNG